MREFLTEHLVQAQIDARNMLFMNYHEPSILFCDNARCVQNRR